MTDLVVMPMRFTDNFVRMLDFLALLGFSQQVRRAEGWAVMAGEAGAVALHSARSSETGAASGQTDLWFEVTDVDALQARFATAGFEDSESYDEAYGRTLLVRDTEGRELGFDEPNDDRYGYQVDEPTPEHGIVSMPLRYEDPSGTFGRLLSAAGFVRLDEGDDQWWRVWSIDGGQIALHPATDDVTPRSARLGFRTREPLKELAERLIAAGHADATVTDDFGGELTVTDPDGQRVLVVPARND